MNLPQQIILFHNFRKLLALCEREKIPIAPLKGAHVLSLDRDGTIERGVMADLDFLVRPNDFVKVGGLLEEIGFVPAVPGDGDYETSYKLELGPNSAVLFDAHQTLFSPSRFSIDQSKIWDRATIGDFDGQLCHRLSLEDHIVHFAVQAAVTRYTKMERYLCDAMFLTKLERLNRDKLASVVGDWRARRMTWLFLKMMLGKMPESNITQCLEAIPVSRTTKTALLGLYRSTGTQAFQKLSYRQKAALVWPVVFDNPRLLLKNLSSHPFLRRIPQDKF